ncbi:MAG: heme-binding domain-containing protein [Planctomycetota bacterium]|nr:heme-binding domain-containing protein [Planctomycetota bacterium]
MSRRKKLGLVILTAFIASQFAPVSRTNPPVTGAVDAPAEVTAILTRSCFDCHSNQTRWPWYASVAPISWLVSHDVEEGREHLNFSEWTGMDPSQQAHAMEEIVEVLDEDEMPLWYYLDLHSQARLTDDERALLVDWASALQDEDASP